MRGRVNGCKQNQLQAAAADLTPSSCYLAASNSTSGLSTSAGRREYHTIFCNITVPPTLKLVFDPNASIDMDVLPLMGSGAVIFFSSALNILSADILILAFLVKREKNRRDI